jgi:ABC-2 type transport system ATP-binding protein
MGSVAEIQKQQQPQREVNVGVLGDPQPMLQWLASRTDIQGTKYTGNQIRFEHQGERESEAGLLREMIQAGFPVCEFSSHTRSLEDVFLAVTKGLVQ